LRPNSTSGSGRIEYRINSRGFRDQEWPYAKNPTAFRVLVVGDSVAFSYKVALEEIFPRRLEVRLRAAMGDVEAVTLAMPGLNTLQESMLLTQEGGRYSPDAAVVAFSLNDARGRGSVP
jgi:hypothetical protein